MQDQGDGKRERRRAYWRKWQRRPERKAYRAAWEKSRRGSWKIMQYRFRAYMKSLHASIEAGDARLRAMTGGKWTVTPSPLDLPASRAKS